MLVHVPFLLWVFICDCSWWCWLGPLLQLVGSIKQWSTEFTVGPSDAFGMNWPHRDLVSTLLEKLRGSLNGPSPKSNVFIFSGFSVVMMSTVHGDLTLHIVHMKANQSLIDLQPFGALLVYKGKWDELPQHKTDLVHKDYEVEKWCSTRLNAGGGQWFANCNKTRPCLLICSGCCGWMGADLCSRDVTSGGKPETRRRRGC